MPTVPLTSQEDWEKGYRDRRLGFQDRHDTVEPVIRKRLIYTQLDKLFRLLLPTGPGRRYLEFGCGDSFWLPYFQIRFGYEVDGIDYSPHGCRLAEERLRRFSTSGRVFEKDFLALGDQFDACYDVCGSFGVVEHFDAPGELLGRFAACLKPGGFLITTIPHLKGFQGTVQRILGRSIYQKHQTMTLKELESVHGCCGLAVRYAGRIGLTTLGLNFGSGMIGRGYEIYNGILDRLAAKVERACRRPVPTLFGSGLVVIAQRV
jgi:SAM-dependent methyltransferase